MLNFERIWQIRHICQLSLSFRKKLNCSLKACRSARGVRRVVLTSSAAAVFGGYAKNGKYSEKDWPDTSQPMAASQRARYSGRFNFIVH